MFMKRKRKKDYVFDYLMVSPVLTTCLTLYLKNCELYVKIHCNKYIFASKMF